MPCVVVYLRKRGMPCVVAYLHKRGMPCTVIATMWLYLWKNSMSCVCTVLSSNTIENERGEFESGTRVNDCIGSKHIKGSNNMIYWGRLYTYHCTVTTRMTSALRWAVMRAILMFHNCEGQSQYFAETVQFPRSVLSC